MEDVTVPPQMLPRDMVHVMRMWDTYVSDVHECCSEKFWHFFLALHTQPGTAIDAALGAAKSQFLSKKARAWQRFPGSRRVLFNRIKRLPNKFWSQIMHTTRIDLSAFGLPVKHVDFKFVDPIFGWVVAAQRQRADDMHWKPEPSYSASGVNQYGGGVQQGISFLHACQSCPEGAHPMGVSLHWDGTGAHGLQASPICIGVANVNSSCTDTQFCLAYIPTIKSLGKTFASSALSTQVKFYIRQRAVGAILQVLETAAKSGVLCQFRNCRGRFVRLLLMPRLLCVNIDQPEAQLFFGMKNKQSCSKCKRRKGYSALRTDVCQCGPTVQCLYEMAQNPEVAAPFRERAIARLERYGFNASRRCLLTQFADTLLVRIPGRVMQVFPCVDFRDRMHGLRMFLHRELTGAANLVPWESRKGLRVKEILDQRLNQLGLQGVLRTGSGSYRIQKSMFSDANMNASDKVCVIFLLPHVFGHASRLIPQIVRNALVTAITCAQLMLIASRAGREYTTSELRQIFDESYIKFFGALEHIYQVAHDASYSKKLRLHRKNPDKNPPPKRFRSDR